MRPYWMEQGQAVAPEEVLPVCLARVPTPSCGRGILVRMVPVGTGGIRVWIPDRTWVLVASWSNPWCKPAVLSSWVLPRRR